MAKVYDVPADLLISKLADILKNEDIPAPSWAPFVKLKQVVILIVSENILELQC